MRFLGLVGRAVPGVRIRVVRPHLVLQDMFSCFLRKYTVLLRSNAYYGKHPRLLRSRRGL